ncbi:MAG: hypothetical protein C6W56_08100 [Caldibacillus debilis]|nr:MAG: hypothetical protein C6W56_08100 [Caldibacillus debilis]
MKRLSGKNRRTGRTPRPIVFKGIFFRLRPCFSFPAAHSSPAAAASERDSIPDGGTDRFLCGPVEGVPGIAGGTTEKHAGKSSPLLPERQGKGFLPPCPPQGRGGTRIPKPNANPSFRRFLGQKKPRGKIRRSPRRQSSALENHPFFI